MKYRKQRFFGSRGNPADEKGKICNLKRFPFPLLPADNSICDISPQWECLFTCALLHMSFCIIAGHDGTGVGEKVRKKRDFWELREEKGKGQKCRDEK